MSEITLQAGGGQFASLRRRRRMPVLLVLCFALIAGVLIMAILGSLIAPHDPNAQDLVTGLSKPSSHHWLGTDSLGRDILSRLIAGSRDAFVGPFLIALGSLVIGDALGLVSGYFGGMVDGGIMRWVDLMWSVPGILVIVVVAGALGGGYWLAVGLLTILTVPFDTRVVRGAVLEQAPRPYVEAAKTLGVPNWRIMALHIWPNVAPVAIANTFLIFAGSLVSLSGLAFLGLGAAPGTPDWGLMLSEGQPLLFVNPIGELAPGLLIVLTATAMNLIGDWVFEQLSSRGATR